MKTIKIETKVKDILNNISLWNKFHEYDTANHKLIIKVPSEISHKFEKNEYILEYAILRNFIGYSENSDLYDLKESEFKELLSKDYSFMCFYKRLQPNQSRKLIDSVCKAGFDVIPFNDGLYVNSEALTVDFDGEKFVSIKVNKKD